MTRMVRSFVISNERRTRRMVTIIKTRQNGLCYLCRLEIRDKDVIVSHGHMNRHYYHKGCAEKLHIL
jgi:hypothetical protein